MKRTEERQGGEEERGTQRLRLATGRFLRLSQVCCGAMHPHRFWTWPQFRIDRLPASRQPVFV